LLHCPKGFRPQDAARPAPASVEYLWRNTVLNLELSILRSEYCNFMSRSTPTGRLTVRLQHQKSPMFTAHRTTGRPKHPPPPQPVVPREPVVPWSRSASFHIFPHLSAYFFSAPLWHSSPMSPQESRGSPQPHMSVNLTQLNSA
jgi:hypothetical protein